MMVVPKKDVFGNYIPWQLDIKMHVWELLNPT